MIHVRLAHWQHETDKQALTSIRQTVFVGEQNVPETEEMDAFDETSQHLLAISDDIHSVGCARIMPTGQIGRMAVVKPFRGTGIGTLLMLAAIEHSQKQGLASIFLHAQCHAETFYQGFGFSRYGGVFEEAGIDHVKMVLDGY